MQIVFNPLVTDAATPPRGATDSEDSARFSSLLEGARAAQPARTAEDGERTANGQRQTASASRQQDERDSQLAQRDAQDQPLPGLAAGGPLAAEPARLWSQAPGTRDAAREESRSAAIEAGSAARGTREAGDSNATAEALIAPRSSTRAPGTALSAAGGEAPISTRAPDAAQAVAFTDATLRQPATTTGAAPTREPGIAQAVAFTDGAARQPATATMADDAPELLNPAFAQAAAQRALEPDMRAARSVSQRALESETRAIDTIQRHTLKPETLAADTTQQRADILALTSAQQTARPRAAGASRQESGPAAAASPRSRADLSLADSLDRFRPLKSAEVGEMTAAGPGTPFAALSSVGYSAGSSAAPAGGDSGAALSEPVGAPAWSDSLANRLTGLGNLPGMRTLELSLNPAQLGPLSVSVSINAQSQAVLSFDAAHPQTRRALDESIERLHEAFSDRGLTLTQVQFVDRPVQITATGQQPSGTSPQFSQGGDTGGFAGQQQAFQQAFQQGGGQGAAPRDHAAPEPGAAPAASIERVASAPQRPGANPGSVDLFA